MEKLLCIKGDARGQEFPVGGLCIIGRSSSAHVRLQDPAASRHHAKITRLTDHFVIEDLDSGWGTMLNGHYINVAYVRHNDEITIADTTFRFHDHQRERSLSDEYAQICAELGPQMVVSDASHPRYLPEADPLEHTLDRLSDRLRALGKVGNVVGRSLDRKAMMEDVLSIVLDVIHNTARALVVVVGEGKKLTIEAVVMRRGTSASRFEFDKSLSEQVLLRGQAILSNEARITGPAGDLARSLLIAPMISRGEVLGFIYADSSPGAAPLTDDDLEVLKCVASHVSLYVHNDRLLEQLRAQSLTRQELAAAHEVQQRFLPRSVPKLPGFSFVAHYDPCRDVGGDLYDFIPLDHGRIGVVIGDVSGKGLAAALVMAWITSQLRIAALQETDPVQVVTRVNDAFLQAKQDNLFVTLIFGVLDWKDMSLSFCNAGHIPPFVYRWDTRRVELADTGAGMPVGLVEGPELEVRRIRMEPGDTVVMVTDGVTEAMDSSEQMFGVERMRGALTRCMPPASHMVSELLDNLNGFVGDSKQYDDITIVAVGSEWSCDDEPETIARGPGWNPSGR